MTRRKLFDEILQAPARIYRSPTDVLRDRRFNDAERVDILRAWRDEVPDAPVLAELVATIAQLQGRLGGAR